MIKTRNVDPDADVRRGLVAFPVVASVGAAVANTTVQATLCVPFKHKLVKATGFLTAIGSGGTHSYDVFDTEGTPATVLSAAATLATANTPVDGTIADKAKERAANYVYTLRAVTPATTGSMTNLTAYLIVQKID